MQIFRSFCVLFFLFCSVQSYSFFDPLPDPEHVRVSLLTVDIGPELPQSYGHTMLRVENQKTGEEYILNWGMYDFSEPYLFVPRFLKGLLRYFVSESTFDSTIRYYHEYEKRSVYQDSLVLTTQQKDRLLRNISKRLEPENVYYWYEFFYNNCSTIPRDILNDALGGKIEERFTNVPATMDLRAYVRRDLNGWSIIPFFLDMMLNSDVDLKLNAWGEMFHPLMLQHYLSQLPQFDDVGNEIPHSHLLQDHHTVVEGGVYPKSSLNFFMCFFAVCLIVLLSIVLLFWKKHVYARPLWGSFYIAWGLFSGFMGCVFLVGWFVTDHHMLQHNANLFVLWPFDFAFVYYGICILKNKNAVYKDIWSFLIYVHLLSIFIFYGLFAWGFFAQDVSNVAKYVASIAVLFYGFCFFRKRIKRAH